MCASYRAEAAALRDEDIFSIFWLKLEGSSSVGVAKLYSHSVLLLISPPDPPAD
jgi:hypothetical protein